MSNQNDTAADTDEVELTAEEQAEQQEQEATEAQKAFEAGFQKIRKDDQAPEAAKPDPAPAEKVEDAPAQQAPADNVKAGKKKDAKPAKAEPSIEDKLNERIRNLEGRIGGLMQKIDTATAQPAAAKQPSQQQQPTTKQVTAALADPAKMERLVREFPEFETVAEGFLSAQSKIAELEERLNSIPKDQPRQPAYDPNETRQLAMLDRDHPDWEDITKSPEFAEFTLAGGPPVDEYQYQRTVEQTDPNTAMRMINSWAQHYPQWWAEKGYALFSTRAADSSKLLSKFKEATTQSTAEEQKQSQDALRKRTNQTRLARAKTPTGIGGAPVAGVSDEEAFERGYRKVHR